MQAVLLLQLLVLVVVPLLLLAVLLPPWTPLHTTLLRAAEGAERSCS
jgi:hypothetical protein